MAPAGTAPVWQMLIQRVGEERTTADIPPIKRLRQIFGIHVRYRKRRVIIVGDGAETLYFIDVFIIIVDGSGTL